MQDYNNNKKDKLISLCVTIFVHALLIMLLVFLGFKYKAPEEESGVLLMVGEVELSAGDESMVSDIEESIVEPEPAPAPVATPVPTIPEPAPEQPLIAQNKDDAPAIAAEKKKKDEAKRKAEEEAKKKQQELDAKRAAEQAKIKAEAEAKAKAEAEARAAAEAEAKRKAEEEAKKRAAAQNLVAGALGKNSGTGTTPNGSQGSPNGNSATGASSGSPGYGSYNLGGRGMVGSLPRPTFNVNASGKVVVKITVNAQGQVIAAEPTTGTTTSSQVLRNAAVEAAKKAKFAVAEGAGNQQGTITYLFDSNN